MHGEASKTAGEFGRDEPARGVLQLLGAAGCLAARLFIAWRARAVLRRQLPAIDDRMLRDIGLSRGDLEREAEKSIWRF